MLVNKWALVALIVSSHFSLFSQKVSANNTTTTVNNESQSSAEGLDRIQLKPLYAPDENYSQTAPTTQNDSNQGNNTQKNSSVKTGSQTLIKPAQWLLESSLDNAPKLLKDIFAYLQSRSHLHKSQYSVIVPSFHRFILVGPPGSGKTTLAHAIAHMLGYSVVFVAATSFLGHYRNQTSINITNFLREQASVEFGIVIIIDELHKLFEHHSDDRSDDSQSAAAFWLTLDNIEKHNPNTIIIGTANNVDKS